MASGLPGLSSQDAEMRWQTKCLLRAAIRRSSEADLGRLVVDRCGLLGRYQGSHDGSCDELLIVESLATDKGVRQST